MNNSRSISDTVDELVIQYRAFEVLTASGRDTNAVVFGRLVGLLGVLMCENEYVKTRVNERLAAMTAVNKEIREQNRIAQLKD